MKQSRMEEILRDYTAGKLDAQQANQELKKMGAPVRLQPGRNEITEAEQQATRVGDTPDQAEGYGLLDTGTGSMEKGASGACCQSGAAGRNGQYAGVCAHWREAVFGSGRYADGGVNSWNASRNGWQIC